MPPTMRRRLAFSPPLADRPLLRFADALCPAAFCFTTFSVGALGKPQVARRGIVYCLAFVLGADTANR